MEEYNEQCRNAINKALNAIRDNKNIIICGPSYSGKSYIRTQVQNLLRQNNYDIYFGISNHNYSNTINGRTYTINKFWIEETNIELLNTLYDEYELIETPLIYSVNEQENVCMMSIS